ncbi:hypothetical protein F442_23061 [Phytophthora nicotianae P10297]|uniref:PiggyBac transposable element-derived protein domain-containing protein n=3 Tax=Phytophthora nicotianae TaxID=4792 RepID=W2Y0E6_PHYNI|nr:hypothetical protein L915_21825 [Phytophthora nicotianae]ETP27659.1 hypothetical protein F442_23061 [Phytophthora nicotianae P10297]
MRNNSTPPVENSGPGAVVRNLRHVLGAAGPLDFRLIVADQFYHSVVLGMTMKSYSIGTLMMNKQGLCEAIFPAKKNNGRRASNKRQKKLH